mgnify:FL=1
MNILFYVNSLKNLNSKNLGGIETLNVSLFSKIKRFNNQTFLTNKITKKIINIHWDCVVSSNNAQIFNHVKSKKKILWLHNKLQLEKAFRKKQFFSVIKNKITAVFNSKFLNRNTSNFYNFDRRLIIPNFLTSDFEKKNRKLKRLPHFIWSVQRDRGLDNILELWIKDIYKNNKNFKLYIYGIQKNKTNKYNLKKLTKYNIIFKGRVNKSVLRKHYLRSMAMICLGYDETFALNVIEGFSCGLPMITFGYSAVGEIVNKKNSFILKNYDSFSQTVHDISNLSFSERNKIINYCIRFSKKFSIENVLDKWKMIIGIKKNS